MDPVPIGSWYKIPWLNPSSVWTEGYQVNWPAALRSLRKWLASRTMAASCRQGAKSSFSQVGSENGGLTNIKLPLNGETDHKSPDDLGVSLFQSSNFLGCGRFHWLKTEKEWNGDPRKCSCCCSCVCGTGFPNKREIERSEKQSQRWQHAMLGREMFRRFGELPLLQGMSPASAMAKLFVDIGLGFVTRGLA